MTGAVRSRLTVASAPSTSSDPNANALRWPHADGPESLAEIERTPFGDRGLPATTYDAMVRAAELWPDRPATSCLRDAEHWQHPSTRTYGELGRDLHRAAAALYALGVRRRDAVGVVSPNCEEMTTALLAAQAVGIASPINPALSLEHAAELLRVSGARVVVAAGPELDADVWARARELALHTGASALIALRPTLAGPQPPELEPLGRTTVAYLVALAAEFDGAGLPGHRLTLPTSPATCTPGIRPARRSSPPTPTPTRSPTPGWFRPSTCSNRTASCSGGCRCSTPMR